MVEDAKLYVDIERACEVWQTFHPLPDVDYTWLLDLCKNKYKELQASNANIESKAAWVFTIGTGGAGLVSFGSVAALSSTTIPLIVALTSLLPFLAMLTAVVFAVLARKPRHQGNPPGGWEGVYRFNYYEDAMRSQGALVAEWELACGWLGYAVFLRGRWLEKSVITLAIGVALLSVPMIAAAVARVSTS